MNDTSKLSIAFKKVIGKAQTDSSKEGYNEAYGTGFNVGVDSVLGTTVPSSPSTTSLWDITDGVVEYVRLPLDPDPSANGHAFIAKLPSNYLSVTSNPKADSGVWINNSIIAATNGEIQVVPAAKGTIYEVKPYRGGAENSQGSGTLVAPGDVIDWYFDYFTGILYQENDPDTTPADIDFIECFLYIGHMANITDGGTF